MADNKEDKQYQDMLLDEIIAEVKKQTDGQARSDSSRSEVIEFVPKRERPKPEPVSEPEPIPEQQQLEMPEPPKEQAPSEPVKEQPQKQQTEGKREKKAAPTRAQQILSELEEDDTDTIEAEEYVPPWRTAKKAPRISTPAEREDDEEDEEYYQAPKPRIAYDLINEITTDPSAAVERLSKLTVSMAARILLMLPLVLTSIYMSVGMTFGLPMPFDLSYMNTPFVYIFILLALQSVSMLLAIEVTASGLWRLLKGRPTMDTLVLFTGLCAFAHGVTIILFPLWGGYLPYCALSTLSCFFALIAKRQRADSLRRAYKVTLMGSNPMAVKGFVDGNKQHTAIKTAEGAGVDLELISIPDKTERFSQVFAPIAMVASLGFAAVASYGVGRPESYAWALAAITSVMTPAGLLMSSSAPFRAISKRLFSSGSMIVNSQCAKALAKCDHIALRDGDIFPQKSVRLHGMKLADGFQLETVISYVASMLTEVGGGLSDAFSTFAKENYISLLTPQGLRFFESGGVSAKIDGKYVLLGNAAFLTRMGVTLSAKMRIKNSLLVAIDSKFAGVFVMKYSAMPQSQYAFRLLRSARISPVLATRDFNANDNMVEDRFSLPLGICEYPELPERLSLSVPTFGKAEQTHALISREGIQPFVETVGAARKVYKASNIGIIFGAVGAVLGTLLMYYLAAGGEVSSATPYNALAFTLLWSIPCLLITSLWSKL